jgi:hypothetical protein
MADDKECYIISRRDLMPDEDDVWLLLQEATPPPARQDEQELDPDPTVTSGCQSATICYAPRSASS